ncbi:(2Fe-2S)-binding protein [Limibacillus halophilus]|uniref:Aerobic-type carbon monoxide dehydrogenase small subunit (CoxS/CutS family) n=1 Tax=Limibacillus halophilus TaxID=1579333 RepID=A0A839SSF7_9PROT|nr:(2Fe-2S)-binding protein [Limibacillus halophilus]MBB3064276.1 aerobic-type carbon monoxide dehydrogenase small subunit (CoxS/CutS family) [Limibacillus halophilus]
MRTLKDGQKHPISFTLNGEEVDAYAEPRTLLCDFLRHEIGASGTHVACEHGVCGACTVLVEGKAVRSCLMLAAQAEGATVETIESLSNTDDEFDDLQAAFHEHFALQCGFCTPGFLMTLTMLKRTGRRYSEAEIRDALSGNICRCTGYKEIVDAALTVLGPDSLAAE